MNAFKLLEYALLAVLLVVLVSFLGGQFLGHPVGLGYVETDSMEPTLNEGDGFVAVPSALAGDVGEGDVVVFEAEAVHGGDVTTHRIVEERDGGYVTQGDNNPFTDQGTGEPVVTDGQVKATALTVDGTVVRIPHLGTGAETVSSALDSAERTVASLFGLRRLGAQQLSYLLFGLGLALFGALFVLERRESDRARTRDRSRSRAAVFDTRLLLAGAVVLLCGGAMLGMVLPAGTETYGIVSTEGNSSDPTIVPQGETDSFEMQVHNGGFLPTVSHFEAGSEGISTDPDRVALARNETRNATVTFEAPAEPGYYVRSMTEHRYLAIIPPSVIDTLYDAHPWAPYVAINAVIVTPLVLLWLLAGPRTALRPRDRSRDRASGLLERL